MIVKNGFCLEELLESKSTRADLKNAKALHAYPGVTASKVEKHAFYVSLLLILEPFISKH